MPGEPSAHSSRTGDPTANTLIEKLVAADKAGHRIPLERLLPPDANHSCVADVACAELVLRLAAGESARVVEYLARFPQLAERDDLVMYLINFEVIGRKKQKDSPPPVVSEYVEAFPHLREEIERFFAGPAEPVRPLPPSPSGYELIEEIGRGGMGVIYRAKDVAMKREVAVKVLQERFKPDSDEAKRFVEETQITGQLQHPGIPPVYQVGKLEDGRPFLAMKLIKGQTLAKLLADGREKVDTLGVFEAICQAVGYAHEAGVIHRDLKPQNVMVGAFNEVQVMDWGLAKFIGAKPPTPTGETRPAAPSTVIEDPRTQDRHDKTGVAGTPWYMAPEQAAGEQNKIDRRTDVFALGGILCAMLTGKPPIEGANAPEVVANAKRGDTTAALELLKKCNAEPELVALCERCLAFEPTERHADAGEVAKAVAKLRTDADERAKQAEMDKAKAEVRTQAERKRRRVLFWAGNIVVGVLLVGVGASLWQMFRAMNAEWLAGQREVETANERDAKDIALKSETFERTKAELAARAETVAKQHAEAATTELWAGLDVMTEDIVGDSLSTQVAVSNEQKEFLASVLPLLQKLTSQGGKDEPTRERVARAAFRIGMIECRIGRSEKGLVAFHKARVEFAKLAADFPPTPEYRSHLAGCHNNLGNVLWDLGKVADAEEQFRNALAIREKLAADFPTAPGYRRELAQGHNNLGNSLRKLRKETEAVEQIKKGLAVNEKLVADFPSESEYLGNLGVSHTELGKVLADLKKTVSAEEHFREALAIQEKFAADFPIPAAHRSDLAGAHSNLGNVLKSLRKGMEAEEQYRKALAIREKLVADFPAAPEHRSELASNHRSLGNLLASLKKGVEAEEQYKKALALHEKLATDFPDLPEYRFELGLSHYNLANLLKSLRKGAEAEEQYKKALAIHEKLATDLSAVPKYRQYLAASHNNLALLYTNFNYSADAEEQHKKGLKLLEKLVADFPDVLEYRIDFGGNNCNFGNLLREGGRTTESLDFFEKAIVTLTSAQKAEPREFTATLFLRNSHRGRAIAYDQLQKHAEAVKDWDRVIELSPPAEQPGFHVRRAKSRLNAGEVDEALTDVVDLTKSLDWDAGQWYDFACVYSVASGKIEDKKVEYTDRAMELLAKAVKVGYTNAAQMRKDNTLDPLRDRDDFRKLLADLETKHPAPKPGEPLTPKK